MALEDTAVFRLGGDLPVHRLAFGAMRLTSDGIWGPPPDRERALTVAREAVALGVDFIDTADAYGLGSNEELLAEALHPYQEGLVIGTKAGQARPGPGRWKPLGRPEYLRQQVELSLRRLRLERIGLFQLHRIDPQVPLADQLGTLRELQDEGRIRHVGLSEVTVSQLEEARRHVDVVSVQNQYDLTNRQHEEVLDYCDRENIAFLPYGPVGRGALAESGGVLAEVAKEADASPIQVALAWLLRRSPVVIPIPGTSSPEHLRENMAAAYVVLSDEQVDRLTTATG